MNSTFRCCGKWVGNRAIKANSAREPFALLLPVPFLSGPPSQHPPLSPNYKRFVSAKIIFLFFSFISRSSISRAADDFISANVCPLARAVTWAESPHYTLNTHTHTSTSIYYVCVSVCCCCFWSGRDPWQAPAAHVFRAAHLMCALFRGRLWHLHASFDIKSKNNR